MEKAYARSRQSGPRWGVSTTVPYPPFVHKGRRVLDIPDGLPFTVSDPAIQWAIDWHERLFSVLQPEGVTFSTGVPQGEKHRQVLIEREKEQLYLSMSEGYKKQDKAPEEVDAKPSAFETSWDWAASGRIKIQAQGTEWHTITPMRGGHSSGRSSTAATSPSIRPRVTSSQQPTEP